MGSAPPAQAGGARCPLPVPTEQAALSIAGAEGPDFATGTAGYVTLSTATVTAAAVAVAVGHTTDDELEDLFFSLAPQYREGAAWFMSDAAIKIVRQFRDSDGRALIDRHRALADVGSPGQLMGLPVYIDPNHNPLAATNKVITLMNPSKHWIRQTQPFMRIDRSIVPKILRRHDLLPRPRNIRRRAHRPRRSRLTRASSLLTHHEPCLAAGARARTYRRRAMVSCGDRYILS